MEILNKILNARIKLQVNQELFLLKGREEVQSHSSTICTYFQNKMRHASYPSISLVGVPW